MKILIVDDEPFVTKGVKRLLSESVAGLEAVYSANNGQEALELAAVTSFDLLITDVCMPLMDGIQLSRIIRSKQPECRILLISSYEDFQVARSALEIGVQQYLLKPIKHDQLVEKVRSIQAELLERQKEKAKARHMEMENGLNDLYQHLRMDMPQEHIAGIDGTKGPYRIARLLTVKGKLLSDTGSFQEAQENWRQMLAKRKNTYLLELMRSEAVLLLCDSDTKDSEWIAQWIAAAEKDALCSMIGAVGCACDQLRDLFLSYRTASLSLGQAYLAGDHSIWFYAGDPLPDGDNPPDDTFTIRADAMKMLELSSLNGDKDGMLYCVNMLMARLLRAGSPLPLQRMLCADFAVTLASELHRSGVCPVADVFALYLNPDTYVRCVTHDELFAVMRDAVAKFDQMMERVREEGGNRLLQTIKAEIQADLQNASLSHLSERMNISAAYISLLFKEKSGVNFRDYLLECRMKEARLRIEKGQSISEIAAAIGYSDTEYFSSRFRQYFGITPAIYRRNYWSKRKPKE